jgi:hypothetical protein
MKSQTGDGTNGSARWTLSIWETFIITLGCDQAVTGTGTGLEREREREMLTERLILDPKNEKI